MPQRLRWLGAAWVLALACAPVQANPSLGIGVEVSVTADDNVTRGYGDNNILSDQFLGLTVSKNLRTPITQNTRLVLQGMGGANAYTRFTGLSHVWLGVQGELQYRTSGAFTAPTLGLMVRAAFEEYQSDLRDSYRNTASLTVRQPLNDKLHLFGALSYLWRDGESEVFDTHEAALRLRLDWSPTARDTIYLGGEVRVGDIVATGRPSLAYVALATAVVPDDVFTDVSRFAYKMEGRTWLVNLGYTRSFGERHALDISWRMATATPDDVYGAPAGSNDVHYTVNQFSLAYLVRF